MALKGVRDISNAIESDGKYHYSYLFKAILPAPLNVGRYIDISQSTGTPKFNAYVGDALTATEMIGSGNNGIYPGNFIPGSTKHIARLQAYLSTGTPAYLVLLDYLMFYPLIDGDSTDDQIMDNPIELPRYDYGQIMLVATVAGSVNGSGTLNYYNQDGILKSVGFNVSTPGQYNISTFVSGAGTLDFCPFIPLADGDIGAKAIESITFSSASGGFFCAVIVKPLVNLPILEATYAAEKQFPLQSGQALEVKPGAYLNFICKISAAASFRSEIIFINS